MSDLRPHPDHSLTRDERLVLTAELLEEAAATQDEAARAAILDDVIVINRKVAESIARRYSGRGIATEDLCQAAYEGLVKAVNRFDPRMDHDLLSFAVPTIRGEVQRHFRDHGWAVRPPRRVQELQWRVNKAIEHLSHELGRDPERRELQAHLEVDEKALDEALSAFGCFHPASLDKPLEGREITIGDGLEAEDHDREASEARLVLSPLVRQLPERDRRILYLRFVKDYTQLEIGDVLGVTQMQVSRLLNRILGQLRVQLV